MEILRIYIDVLSYKKGSVIGVKARLAQRYFEYEDGKSFSYPEVIAEKITFINTKKEK